MSPPLVAYKMHQKTPKKLERMPLLFSPETRDNDLAIRRISDRRLPKNDAMKVDFRLIIFCLMPVTSSISVRLMKKATQKSRKAFLDEMRRCELLGLKLLNFHPGVPPLVKISETECLRRNAESINMVLQKLRRNRCDREYRWTREQYGAPL